MLWSMCLSKIVMFKLCELKSRTTEIAANLQSESVHLVPKTSLNLYKLDWFALF